MVQETFTIDGTVYGVIQSVRLDGVDYVVAQCPDAAEPFVCWRRSAGRQFGEEPHMLPVFGDDYVRAMRMFARQISVAVGDLEHDRACRRPQR